MNYIKKNPFVICISIFSAGLIFNTLELIAFGTTSNLDVSTIIMTTLNYVLFIGIIAACITKNVRGVKILTVTLLAWDGIAYLTGALPAIFASMKTEMVTSLFAATVILTVCFFLVTLAAIIFLLGLLLNKNFNRAVIGLYLISAFLTLIVFVFHTIYVTSGNESLWGIPVETLLKTCVYAGTAMGIYLFDLKEKEQRLT